MPMNVSSLLWFFAVVALIPLTLWLLKRTPLGAGSQRAGTPRMVAVLPLSTQQKLVTVEVGAGEDRLWLVLGVSPQGIRTLHTMAAQADGAAPVPQAPPSAAFAQLLSRLRGNEPPHAP
jgi:flagellar protein FliO/FliZ